MKSLSRFFAALLSSLIIVFGVFHADAYAANIPNCSSKDSNSSIVKTAMRNLGGGAPYNNAGGHGTTILPPAASKNQHYKEYQVGAPGGGGAGSYRLVALVTVGAKGKLVYQPIVMLTGTSLQRSIL